MHKYLMRKGKKMNSIVKNTLSSVDNKFRLCLHTSAIHQLKSMNSLKYEYIFDIKRGKYERKNSMEFLRWRQKKLNLLCCRFICSTMNAVKLTQTQLYFNFDEIKYRIIIQSNSNGVQSVRF